MTNNQKIIAGIVALAAIAASSYYYITTHRPGDESAPPAINSAPPAEGVVARIVDSTTVQVESGHHIRYIGVRTPESGAQVQCFGKEALLANESVVGKKVRLEEEPLLKRSSDGAWTMYVWMQAERTPAPATSIIPSIPPQTEEQAENGSQRSPAVSPERDFTGTSVDELAEKAKEVLNASTSPQPSPNSGEEPTPSTSSLPEQGDVEGQGPTEIFINERILEGGFAFPVVSPDMKYGERLLSAAKFASATGRGLWSRCEITGTSPQLTTQKIDECVIKGKVTNDLQKIYRTPDCPAYQETVVLQGDGGQWFCAEDTAIDAGFTKASDCE